MTILVSLYEAPFMSYGKILAKNRAQHDKK